MLVKQAFKEQIKAGISAIDMNSPNISDQITDIFCDAIDAYIKSATITVAAGIPVSTAGTALAQTGATTAPATATIS
jgi:hypothetical protein